jgi:integrase
MEIAVHDKPSVPRKVAPNLYRATSGRYYLLVKRGGKQFRRSLKTNDFALAKRRLREFQDKAGRLSGDSVDRAMQFEDLAERWLASRKPELKASSYTRRVTALKGLGAYFNGHPVRSIGQKQVEHWKTKRGGKLSARTWNIEVETLNQVFNYAKDNLRVILENPVHTVKRRKSLKRGVVIPTKEQFRIVLNELRNGHRATGQAADFAEFLAYSGCRQAEAFEVLWRDIDFERGCLVVTGGKKGTKNGDARSLPLFAPLRRLLEDAKARRAGNLDEPVFAIRSALLQMHRACERLELPAFGHHTMRHFFCSNAIEAGCDFKVIAEWLGHKDGGVLVAQTYGHLRNEHSAAMAHRMNFDAGAPSNEITGEQGAAN